MAVGSWAKFVGSGTNDTTLQAARNTWADWDFEGGSGWVETDADSLVSESTSNFTIAAAGRYLIIWRIKYDATHGNRLTMKSRLRGGASGTTLIEGAECFSYSRNNNNDKGYMNGQIMYDATASDVIDIQYLVDISDGSETVAWQATSISITFIRLTDSADTAFAYYTDSSETASFAGQTFLDADWNTIEEETDTAVIQRNADGEGIDVKGSAGDRFLFVMSMALDVTAGSLRTQRICRATVAQTTQISATRSYCYMRDVDNGTCNINVMFIFEKQSGSTETIRIQLMRDGADIDGTVARVVDRSGLWVMKLLSTTEIIGTHDETANQDISTVGGLPITINGARTADFNDSAAFTAPAITDVNCVKGMDVLFWANIYAQRAGTADGTRLSRLAQVELVGSNQTYGEHGSYLRGDQATSDTFSGSFHPYSVETVSATDDFQVEILDDGDDGDLATTRANFVGYFAINLDTLAAAAPAARTLFSRPINVSAMI